MVLEAGAEDKREPSEVHGGRDRGGGAAAGYAPARCHEMSALSCERLADVGSASCDEEDLALRRPPTVLCQLTCV